MLLSEHADSLELAATLETHVPGLGQAEQGTPHSRPHTGGRRLWENCCGLAQSNGCCRRAVGSAPLAVMGRLQSQASLLPACPCVTHG